MKIKKYFAYFKITWQYNLAYRMDLLVIFLASLISLISIYYLWNNIFQNQSEIFGYTKKHLVTYYILVGYLIAALNGFVPVAKEIRSGKLSNYLTQPINYLLHHYWQVLSTAIFTLIIGLPIVILIFFIFQEHLILITGIKSYLLLIFVSLGAINISFLFYLLISFLEFWILYSDEGFVYMTDIVISFFAGALIPLSFLPSYIQSVGNFLPFKYTTYFIIDTFLGRLSNIEIFIGFIMQLLWILILFLLVSTVWSIGLKKYQAVGK